jgi:hypothetical protein
VYSGVAGVECCIVFTEHVHSDVAGVECYSVFLVRKILKMCRVV